ncbi:MAG: hypothetical protein H6696_18220 [Deferribacteres bacterium]|nr:hypothetical protein [Deferribacteres bacterium]
MATFESKVSEIFDENPKLARSIPTVIRKIFQESEFKFKQRLRNETEAAIQQDLTRLYDILFIDYYHGNLNDRFISWVIKNRANAFTEEELDEMRAQSESHLDFYEIQKVVPGKGSYIKSLCGSNAGFLNDISTSRSLVKWDIMLMRCYFYRGEYHATGTAKLFQRQEKEFIVERIEEARSERRMDSLEFDYADFAKTHWDIFFQIEREIARRGENRKFYTKYGILQLCEVHFQVNDIQSLLAKIDDQEEFNFIESKRINGKKKNRETIRHQFDWLSCGIEKELEPIQTGEVADGLILSTSQLDNKGNSLGIEAIGTLFVEPYLCRLETRSLDLAEFAKNHFEHIFGDSVKFKRIVKLKMDFKRDRKNAEEPEEANLPDQIDPKVLKSVGEKYYLGLLDESIPALNNLTPREARHDAVAYPLLVDWLKSLENMAEKKDDKMQIPVPVKRIKKELKIDW